MEKRFKVTDKNKKIMSICGIVVAVLATLLIANFWGRQLIAFVSDSEGFKAWVQEKGVFAKVAFIGIMALQVIVAIIPGEPLEIGAGYAFGVGEGTILCLLGALAGSLVIFALVKKIGMPMVQLFFKKEDIANISFLKNTEKLTVLLFIIFLIPGTPKDMLSYFVGLTSIKMHTWLLISTVARIPSVITSTIGGNALGSQNYVMAAVVFALTIIISLFGLFLYKYICYKNHKEKKTDGNA